MYDCKWSLILAEIFNTQNENLKTSFTDNKNIVFKLTIIMFPRHFECENESNSISYTH